MFARSAIFSVQERSKVFISKRMLASHQGSVGEVIYTGPQLHQQHSLVWQAIVALFVKQQEGIEGGLHVDGQQVLRTTRRELLRAAGKETMSSSAREWIWSVLKELQAGQLEIRTERMRFVDNLLGAIRFFEKDGGGRKRGDVEITVERDMLYSLRNDVALIDLAQKAAYRNQLTMLLYNFIASQSNATNPYRWKISDLQKWSGSALKVPQFRFQLRKSCDSLLSDPRKTDAASPLLTTWKIDKDDCLVFEKKSTRVIRIAHVGALEKLRAHRGHADAVAVAKTQRATVLL